MAGLSQNCKISAISAGAYYDVALMGSGFITGWGTNSALDFSQYYHLNQNGGIKKISCDGDSLLVLTSQNRILGFGDDTDKHITSGQKLTGVKDIITKYGRSFAILSDNTITGWGRDDYGQASEGNGLTGVVSIGVGGINSIALLSNGTITGWGDNSVGQMNSVAYALTGIYKISLGDFYAIALLSNGTITGWGDDTYGQYSIGNGLTGVTDIAAGNHHYLALFQDMTITGWGNNSYGEAADGNGLTGVSGISAGLTHSLALLNNGTVTGWGSNSWQEAISLTGQCPPRVDYINLNGLTSGTQYVIGQQSEWTRLSYSGFNITVSKWASGQNYSNSFTSLPSVPGKYSFNGEIIDSNNYQYYGEGTGLLKINSGVFAWSGAGGVFTGGNMSYIYDGNYHYFGAYNNYQVYNWFLDVEPYRLIDVNNPSAGPICYPSFVDTKTNTLISSYPSLPPSNAGNYIQVYNCDVLKNYISGDSIPTGYINIQQIKSKIIINSFNNPYTSAPNPIGVFTYPNDIPLTITYNGSGTIPTNKGDYYVEIKPTNNNYNADIVTGIYSIVGDLQAQSYALGWGNDISRNIELPSAPTGLLGVQKLVGGNDFSIALMSDNSIVTWGTGNQYGQQNIPYINNYVRDIYASNNTTFIIDWSGNLTGCGYLFNTVGNGYNGNIPLLTGISGVSAADYYAIAISQDLNKPLTGWGDRNLAQFNYTTVFNSLFTGITNVCATNLGCVCQVRGINALCFGNKKSGGFYNQFSWSGFDSYNVKKIACSDFCTLFLYYDKTFTGYGMLGDSNAGLHPFYIPDQSVQGKVLDIAVSSGHVLLTTSQYVAPLPPPPPDCTGITYV